MSISWFFIVIALTLELAFNPLANAEHHTLFLQDLVILDITTNDFPQTK